MFLLFRKAQYHPVVFRYGVLGDYCTFLNVYKYLVYPLNTKSNLRYI